MPDIKKYDYEKLILIASKAALSIKGVAALVNAPIPLDLHIKTYSKGIVVLLINNELVLDVYVNVLFGTKIPELAFKIQESIKKTVEKNTDYKIAKINIHIQGLSN